MEEGERDGSPCLSDEDTIAVPDTVSKLDGGIPSSTIVLVAVGCEIVPIIVGEIVALARISEPSVGSNPSEGNDAGEDRGDENFDIGEHCA